MTTNGKPAVRLTVVNRTVSCPYGAGARNLHDCYIDSVTAGSFCVDPQKTGASRCPQVAVFRATYGWRTHRVVPEACVVNDVGQVQHHSEKLRLIYAPLDPDGQTWFATNLYTGQRYEVVPADVRVRSRGRTVGPWTAAYRLTPEGEDMENEWRMLDPLAFREQQERGGMFQPRYLVPIWNDVPPRDEWRCECDTCTGKEKRRTMLDPDCKQCRIDGIFGGCALHRRMPGNGPAPATAGVTSRAWRERERRAATPTPTPTPRPAARPTPAAKPRDRMTAGAVIGHAFKKTTRK